MLNRNQLPDVLHIKRLKQIDVLLIALSVDVNTPKSVKEIKTLVRDGGFTEVNNWPISSRLKNSKGLAVKLKEGWSLTSRGRKHIENIDIIPSTTSLKVTNQAKQLRKISSSIEDDNTKSFIEEAITTYEAGLYRSAIVLSWQGAISILYNKTFSESLNDFNREASRRNSKWKDAIIQDDLTRMKESDFLDIIGTPPLSIINKNLKEELKNQCLRLRNSCGHPNSLKIGENKTAAHLEILILNIFSKFVY